VEGRKHSSFEPLAFAVVFVLYKENSMDQRMKSNLDHHLVIGGMDATHLAYQYQTPLYVMDETMIRSNCQIFLNSFKHPKVNTEVIYASKAFLTIGMAQLIQSEGLSVDVVSGGELYTVIQAGFPADRIFLHGNNKSDEEINMAIRYNVGTIVVDNADEIKRILKHAWKGQLRIMLRINPGIEAHTHEYIKTTKNDSKFGLSVFDPKTMHLIQEIHANPRFDFVGFHTHIGSQIFESESFMVLAQTVLGYISSIKSSTGIEIKEMNLGGGFGVRYTKADQPFDIQTFLPDLLERIASESDRLGIMIPKTLIEPGRAIVAEAGYTLYSVSGTKETFGGKRFVFTDGSMADHIRTALYQATYEAVIANDLSRIAEHHYTVTGKACESGDIIIKDIKLPTPVAGDILAVLSTGAYHYSMSSNYNRLLKPAVVFVSNGHSRLVVKRETYDDLLRNDCR
jgi:diaminopimelate decarboxylase